MRLSFFFLVNILVILPMSHQAPTPCNLQTPCPLGHICNNNNNCIPCNLGSFNNISGSTSCTLCPAGSFGITIGAISESSGCLICDAGSYNPISGASFCIDCPKGTFSNKTGATSPSTCEKCPRGFYSFGTSNTFCSPCPSGTFADKIGTNLCTDCSPGTYGTSIASVTNATCQYCPSGTYNPSSGQTFSNCIPCPIGTSSFQVGAKSVFSCKACPEGQYSDMVGQSICAGCAYGLQPAPGSFLSIENTISSKCVLLTCPTEGIYINGTLLTTTFCSGCLPGYYGNPNTQCIKCKPEQTCPGLLSQPLLSASMLLPQVNKEQLANTASMSWIASKLAVDIATQTTSKNTSITEDTYFTIIFGTFVSFMALIVSTYVISLRTLNHTVITAGSVEHQREFATATQITTNTSATLSNSKASFTTTDQRSPSSPSSPSPSPSPPSSSPPPPSSLSFHHKFLITLGMSDRFSAGHFTPPGEFIRSTPTALGGILTIAGFGLIIILAIQLIINYFSETSNTLISTTYVLTGDDTRQFQWNKASFISSSFPVSNDWRTSITNTKTIQGLVVRIIVQGEKSGECAQPLDYIRMSDTSSIVSMKPMTWMQPNALGPITNTSAVFSYLSTGIGRITDGIAEHVFICLECNLAYANKIQVAFHWTCQSIALEIASVPESNLLSVVNATSYREGIPIEAQGRLTSMTWKISSILPTVTTNAYYSTKPITIYRGFRLGSGIVSFTQAKEKSVQPASATVVVTIELPENDFREEVSITAKVNVTQLISSILGLVGALSIFRLLMKFTEMGFMSIENRRKKSRHERKISPVITTSQEQQQGELSIVESSSYYTAHQNSQTEIVFEKKKSGNWENEKV
jgi:hypothetical protein